MKTRPKILFGLIIQNTIETKNQLIESKFSFCLLIFLDQSDDSLLAPDLNQPIKIGKLKTKILLNFIYNNKLLVLRVKLNTKF